MNITYKAPPAFERNPTSLHTVFVHLSDAEVRRLNRLFPGPRPMTDSELGAAAYALLCRAMAHEEHESGISPPANSKRTHLPADGTPVDPSRVSREQSGQGTAVTDGATATGRTPVSREEAAGGLMKWSWRNLSDLQELRRIEQEIKATPKYVVKRCAQNHQQTVTADTDSAYCPQCNAVKIMYGGARI